MNRKSTSNFEVLNSDARSGLKQPIPRQARNTNKPPVTTRHTVANTDTRAKRRRYMLGVGYCWHRIMPKVMVNKFDFRGFIDRVM